MMPADLPTRLGERLHGPLVPIMPAFRDDVSGFGGIGYRTYLDLLSAVRAANRSSPGEERLRVVAVSNPTYWPAIASAADVANFRRSLAGRDYDMYRLILEELDGFGSGKKGVFLTNTRHAYTGIRDARGELHWNTGTFFRERHPGKTCSIRIHNVTLAIERVEPDPVAPRGIDRSLARQHVVRPRPPPLRRLERVGRVHDRGAAPAIERLPRAHLARPRA